MTTSQSIKNIAMALCKFQEECDTPRKTANNPHYKSKYAPLEEIIRVIKPALAKNGLSYFQTTSTEGTNIVVTTVLMHISGEYIEGMPLSLPMGKTTAQSAGSSITYARRYSLCAMLGIAAEEDDDGNNASVETRSEQPSKTLATDKQLDLIKKLLNDIATTRNITPKQAYEVLKNEMKKDIEYYTVTDGKKAITFLQSHVKGGN